MIEIKIYVLYNILNHVGRSYLLPIIIGVNKGLKMTKLEWIAQIIGIVAMGIIILSYQQKKQSTVIAFQLFGSALFAINFFMLGAIMGGLLNFIAIIRAIVFLNKKKVEL